MTTMTTLITLAVVVAVLPGMIRLIAVVGDRMENYVEHSTRLKSTFDRLG